MTPSDRVQGSHMYSQFPQMVGSLVIPSYEDGEHWSFLGSVVVLVERLHVPILDRCSHAVQVSTVTHCLYNESCSSGLHSYALSVQ